MQIVACKDILFFLTLFYMYLLSNKVAENASIIQQIVKKLNFVSVTINIPAAKKVNVTIKCIIAGSCKTRPLYIIYLSL